MIAGICKIDIAISGARSLKAKRQVLRKVKDRVKAKFNVSIAEVGNHDIYQTATIGIAVMSSDSKHADSQLSSVIRFVEGIVEIRHVSTEVIKINNDY